MAEENKQDFSADVEVENLEWQSSVTTSNPQPDSAEDQHNNGSPAGEHQPMEEAAEDATAENDATSAEIEAQEVADSDPVDVLRAQRVYTECHPISDWDSLCKWQWFMRCDRPGVEPAPFLFVRNYSPDHEFPSEEGRIRADTVLGEQRDLSVEEPHIDERGRIAREANQRHLFWNVRAYIFEIGRYVRLKGLTPLAPPSVYIEPVMDSEGRSSKAPYLPASMHLKDAYDTLLMPLEQPLGFLVKTANDGYWPLERVVIVGGDFEPQKSKVKYSAPLESENSNLLQEKQKEPSPEASEKPGPSDRDSPKPGPSRRVPAEMPSHLRRLDFDESLRDPLRRPDFDERLRDIDEQWARSAPRGEELRRQGIISDQPKQFGRRRNNSPRKRPEYRDYSGKRRVNSGDSSSSRSSGSHTYRGRVSKPEGPFKGPQPKRTFTNSNRKHFDNSNSQRFSNSSQSGSEGITTQLQQLTLPPPMQQIPPNMPQMPMQWPAPQMMPINAGGMPMMGGYGFPPSGFPNMQPMHDPSRVFVCPICRQVHLHGHTAFEPCMCHPTQRH